MLRELVPIAVAGAIFSFAVGCSTEPAQTGNGNKGSSGQAESRPKLWIGAVSDIKTTEKAKLDVIFVHGLAGDAYTTWTNDAGDFWPKWLAEDLKEDVAVWTLAYEASVTKWDGGAMPLSDRAASILNLLGSSSRTNFGQRPIIFVTHSLGGLVAKKCLQTGLAASGDESMKKVAEQTIAIVFFATPHTGSDSANWLKYVASALSVSISDASEDLGRNNAMLRDLHMWFQNNCRDRLKTKCYFEKIPLRPLGLIVDEGSALDNLSSDPVPCDADHVSICKFPSRGEYEDSGVLKFIQQQLETVVAKSSPSQQEPVIGSIEALFEIKLNKGDPGCGKLRIFDGLPPSGVFKVPRLPEAGETVDLRRSGAQLFVFEKFALGKPDHLSPMSTAEPWQSEEYSLEQTPLVPPAVTPLLYTDHHRTHIIHPVKGSIP